MKSMLTLISSALIGLLADSVIGAERLAPGPDDDSRSLMESLLEAGLDPVFALEATEFPEEPLDAYGGDGTRTGECRTDRSCSNLNYNWPSGTFSTTSSAWTTVSTTIWPGDYAYYSVQAGYTYEWTLCPADGAYAPYDSQLTLRQGSTVYCYSDDYCDLDAKIRWTAPATQTVIVLVSRYNCATEENPALNTTLRWRREDAGTPLPDLHPYQPAGFSAPIVVSTGTGYNTDDDPLFEDQALYVDWGVANTGTATTSVTFYVLLRVDGVPEALWYRDPPMSPNTGFGYLDVSIGILPAGPHTVSIEADFDNRVVESNESNNYYERTFTVSARPAGGNLLAAASRKPNIGGPGGVCDLPVDLVTGDSFITSDPRQEGPTNTGRGITQLVLGYDAPPADTPLTIEEDATCPSPPAYGPYTGASLVSCAPADNTLVCTFTPALENARTYRFTVPDGVGTRQIEIRGLLADVNSDGSVNALDRGVLIGVWTGAFGGDPCQRTNLNNDGSTNALDRGMLIGAWTGAQNCAP